MFWILAACWLEFVTPMLACSSFSKQTIIWFLSFSVFFFYFRLLQTQNPGWEGSLWAEPTSKVSSPSRTLRLLRRPLTDPVIQSTIWAQEPITKPPYRLWTPTPTVTPTSAATTIQSTRMRTSNGKSAASEKSQLLYFQSPPSPFLSFILFNFLFLFPLAYTLLNYIMKY